MGEHLVAVVHVVRVGVIDHVGAAAGVRTRGVVQQSLCQPQLRPVDSQRGLDLEVNDDAEGVGSQVDRHSSTIHDVVVASEEVAQAVIVDLLALHSHLT